MPRSTVIATAVLTLIALVITGLALRHPGITSSDVDVNNGGVWVTNAEDGLMARLNVDAAEFDARVVLGANRPDLVQSGYTVLETDARGVTPINTAAVARGGRVELPSGTTTTLGGDRVALSAPDGRVWVLSPEQAAAFSPAQVEPVHESSGGTPPLVVTDRGTVWLLDGDQLVSFPRQEDPSKTTASAPTTVAGVSSTGGVVTMTAVGETPVILDREARLLRVGLDGRDLDLTSSGINDLSTAVLQQPSGPADSVLLATPDALLEVPLGGGPPITHPAGGTGTPAPPARTSSCVYGAWNDSHRFVRRCGSAEAEAGPVTGATGNSELLLRRNHDLVVLNDHRTGASWMIADQMQLVDEWLIQQDVQTDDSRKETEETITSTITNVSAERDGENRPPVAADDTFGVRAGANVVLPVARNDTDPDGDLITVSVDGAQPSIGTVSAIRGGTQLQVAVDPAASGSATFTYRADDGRGGTDTATVTLQVHPDSSNSAPEQADQHLTKVKLRTGASVSLNILPYWQDPEGDAFYLADASIPPEDLVTFRPDGRITIDDAGLTTGTKQVQLTFRDEHGATAEGTLELESVDETDLAPITTGDHLQVVAGRDAVVHPLRNDIDPGGGGLELTHVAELEQLEVQADLITGAVTVRGETPGTYYVDHTVGAGAESAPGLLRVDVIDPGSQDLAPVTVDDLVMVSTGGRALVDPLENDVDPSGGVLVVTSVQVPEDSGLTARVLENHLIEVEVAPDAQIDDSPITLAYEAANATGSTLGSVQVLLSRTATQLANPVARPDQAIVRAGDMVMVDVLGNDTSPTGARLQLSSVTPTAAAQQMGRAEVHQDRIRFSAAPGASGEAYLMYEVTDATGRSGSARLAVTVIADDSTNQAPQPPNQEARTIAGSPVRIPVPLTGIDPDGDSVMLMGISGAAPEHGEVTSASGEWIEYTPTAGAVGTDRFQYQVIDQKGAVGTAEVLVGIARPASVNQRPQAVDDVLEVRPDRVVQIPVLDNDSDPEGAPLSLTHEATESVTGIEVITPEGESGRSVLTVRTPQEPGTHTVLYAVSDGQLSATGSVTIMVDPAAPLLAPIASDDFVAAADVLDPEQPTIMVPVLANDRDPDGTVDDLEVELVDPPANVTLRDGVVEVDPQDDAQRIGYTVTDVDGLSSTGYVWVPGRAMQAPVWTGGTVEVRAGATATIDLGDPQAVRVRPGGNAVTITDPGTVTAAHHDGGSLVVDATTLEYRPQEGYVGPDAITVQVSDGEPGAPTSVTTGLTIPIQVQPGEGDLPPAFRGAVLEVETGGPVATLDLAASADDPEGAELSFALGEFTPDAEVDVTVEGSELRADASAEATSGSILQVPVTVSDGENDPVEATFQVIVTGSSRPLPSAVRDTVEVHAGSPVMVPVLENDSNPFPGEPLRLVSAATVNGDGSVRVVGDQVEITPDAEFAGLFTASYTVQDATGDPERQVSGEISATVLGKPAAPSAPRVQAVGDGSVDLQLIAGDDNGSPVTGYTVTSATGPPVEQSCSSTTCTVTGLSNGSEYTFQVVAHNAVGASPASAPSAVARPDVRPEPPSAPTAERGDGRITVSWTPPVNRGSALQRYELQMQDNDSGRLHTREVEAGTTQLVWDGLTNGVAQRFRIRAANLAEEPSEWSPWSPAVRPAGPPMAAAAAPDAQRVNDPLGGGIQVDWPAHSAQLANGEPVTEYVVTASDGTAMTVGAGTTRATFRDLDPDTSYSFTVAARNDVGQGPAGPSSPAVVPFAVPEAPEQVTATLPDDGTGEGPKGRATVSWTAASGRGTPIKEYVVSWDGGQQVVAADVTRLEVTGLTDGSSYVFTVQARNRFAGGESAPARSNAVVPYTVPAAPSITIRPYTCPGLTDLWCAVSADVATADDGGVPLEKYEYRIIDTLGVSRGWYDVPVAADGTGTFSTGKYLGPQQFRIEVRAVNEKGLVSEATTQRVQIGPGVSGP